MNNLLLAVRAVLRLLRISLHLIWGGILILTVYPSASRAVKLSLKQKWSSKALLMFGIQVQVKGQLAAHMRVSNHISWLDIVIINAIIPSVFIAKDDVRRWPLFGWFSTHTETYFIQRDSRRAASKASKHITELLHANIDILAFPEGTTTNGDEVLPFYSALLQGAVVVQAPVQPIAIRYQDKCGHINYTPAFCGDMNLVESLWRVASADFITATVYLLPSVESATHDRRTLTTTLHDNIVECLNQTAFFATSPSP